MSKKNSAQIHILLFATVHTADTDLNDRCVFFGTCHHTGVIVCVAFIFTTQIGMGVKLQNRQVVIPIGNCLKDADTDGVVAAENDGEFMPVQQCSRSLTDGFGNLFRRAKPFNSRFGKDAFSKNLAVGFNVIKLKVV